MWGKHSSHFTFLPDSSSCFLDAHTIFSKESESSNAGAEASLVGSGEVDLMAAKQVAMGYNPLVDAIFDAYENNEEDKEIFESFLLPALISLSEQSVDDNIEEARSSVSCENPVVVLGNLFNVKVGSTVKNNHFVCRIASA